MDGQRALLRKDADGALKLADKAEQLNPGFYQNAALRTRALLALGRHSEATQALEAALAEHPAFLSERRALEELLRQATSSKQTAAK